MSCTIFLTDITASNSTSIFIQGTVTGPCTELTVTAEFPGNISGSGPATRTRIATDEYVWSITFAGLDALKLKEWCKDAEIGVTARCLDEHQVVQCEHLFSKPLTCCPTFSNLGFTIGSCLYAIC